MAAMLEPVPPAAPRPDRYVAQPAYALGRVVGHGPGGGAGKGKPRMTAAYKGQVAAISDVEILIEAERGLRGVVQGNEARRRGWLEMTALEGEEQLIHRESFAAAERAVRHAIAQDAVDAFAEGVAAEFYATAPAVVAADTLHELRARLVPSEARARRDIDALEVVARRGVAPHYHVLRVAQVAVQEEPYARCEIEVAYELLLERMVVGWVLSRDEEGERGDLSYECLLSHDDLAAAKLERWNVETDELCHREVVEDALLERLLDLFKAERLWRGFLTRHNPRQLEATLRAQIEQEQAADFATIERRLHHARGRHVMLRLVDDEAAEREMIAHHADWSLGRIHLLGHRQWLDAYAVQTYLTSHRQGLETRHRGIRRHIERQEATDRGALEAHADTLARIAAAFDNDAALLACKEAAGRRFVEIEEARGWAETVLHREQRLRLESAADAAAGLLHTSEHGLFELLKNDAVAERKRVAVAVAFRDASYMLREHDEPIARFLIQRDWLHHLRTCVAQQQAADHAAVSERDQLIQYEGECRNYVVTHERVSADRLATRATALRRQWEEGWALYWRNAATDVGVEEAAQRHMVHTREGRELRVLGAEELRDREAVARLDITNQQFRVAGLNFAAPLQCSADAGRWVIATAERAVWFTLGEAERRERAATLEREMRGLISRRAAQSGEKIALVAVTRHVMATGGRGEVPQVLPSDTTALGILLRTVHSEGRKSAGLSMMVRLQGGQGDHCEIAAAVARGGMHSTEVQQELAARRRDDLASLEDCARLAVGVLEASMRGVVSGLRALPLAEAAGRAGIEALEEGVHMELLRVAVGQAEGKARYTIYAEEMQLRHGLAEAALHSYLEALRSPPRARAPTPPPAVDTALLPFHSRAIHRKEALARDAIDIVQARIWARALDVFAAEARRLDGSDHMSDGSRTVDTVSTLPPRFHIVY